MFSVGKARKAAALMTRPSWRRGLMLGVAATIEHLPLAKLIRPRTVIDIGANKGQFSLFALEAFPGCQIFAFEPLPSPAQKFRRVLGGYGRVKLFSAAIGPRKGIAEIHISEREDSSSLLPISKMMGEVFPEAVSSGETLNVRLGRLDEFLTATEIIRPSLLKLDVQGYELEALKGCENLLKHFDNLYVECSEMALYEGQAIRSDIDAYLLGYGFHSVVSLNETIDKRFGPVQSDVLFTRLQA